MAHRIRSIGSTSPRCEHYWHDDFRVNGRRYRNTTDTADKHKARDIEAKERSRILEGRHGIRRTSPSARSPTRICAITPTSTRSRRIAIGKS
jgi:hypothetical protein